VSTRNSFRWSKAVAPLLEHKKSRDAFYRIGSRVDEAPGMTNMIPGVFRGL
jgi:hypothetical protein